MVDADDDIGRGGAETFLGLAYWGMGDLESGFRWYDQGMASLERAGMVADVVGGSIVGADIRLATGRLTRCERIYDDGLARATRSRADRCAAQRTCTPAWRTSPTSADDLDEAQAQLEAGRRLGDEFGVPARPVSVGGVVQARILQAHGDSSTAR